MDEALDAADRGEQVILVRDHTRPEDVHGMLAAQGIVTEVGGAASHAAVVSRELGRVAVVGCGHGVAASLAGKQITVDGYEGEVREGNLTLSAWSENDTPELRELAEIARRVSPLRAHATGDHPRLDDTSDAAVRAALDSGQTDVVSATPADRHAGRAAAGGPGCVVTELAVLQAVRLKGRVTPADLAATLGEDLDDVTETVEQLTGSGLAGRRAGAADQPQRSRQARHVARRGARGHRLGRDRRPPTTTSVPSTPISNPWSPTGNSRAARKARPTPTTTPNTTPRCWPASTRCTRGWCRSSTAAATQLPRLSAYSAKLSAALDKIKAGDTAWLTRPLIDSYHTVWFELHEELIGAVGLTREASGQIR